MSCLPVTGTTGAVNRLNSLQLTVLLILQSAILIPVSIESSHTSIEPPSVAEDA